MRLAWSTYQDPNSMMMMTVVIVMMMMTEDEKGKGGTVYEKQNVGVAAKRDTIIL